MSSVLKYKKICRFDLTDSARACCKECRLLLWEDVSAQTVPRPAFPGPRGILATDTNQAQAVTTTVDSLGIVQRMLCNEKGEGCSWVYLGVRVSTHAFQLKLRMM